MDRHYKMAEKLMSMGYKVEYVYNKPYFYKGNDIDTAFDDMKQSTNIGWMTDHFYHLLTIIRSSKADYVTVSNLELRSSYEKHIIDKFVNEAILNHCITTYTNTKGEICCELTRTGKWSINVYPRPTDLTITPVHRHGKDLILSVLTQPMTFEEIIAVTEVGQHPATKILNHLAAVNKIEYKNGKYQKKGS